jgi:hypothetical protein
MLTTFRFLPAVLAAAALVTACGGGGTETTGRAADPQRPADSGQAVKYARCMRDNGVPAFPDPKDGRLVLRAEPGSDLDPTSPAFEAAQEACRTLAPSGPKEGSPQAEELQEQALAHARCMRENGVPDWPDPDFSGAGVRMRVPEGADRSAVQAAQKACGDMLERSRR